MTTSAACQNGFGYHSRRDANHVLDAVNRSKSSASVAAKSGTEAVKSSMTRLRQHHAQSLARRILNTERDSFQAQLNIPYFFPCMLRGMRIMKGGRPRQQVTIAAKTSSSMC